MGTIVGMTARLTRLIAMALVGLLGIAIGVVIDQSDPGPDFVPAEFLSGFGLTIFVPLVVLVIASATLGVLQEEKTMVYFWLRPIGRWRITVSAFAAGLLVLVPLILIPMAILGLVVGDSDDVVGILVGSIVGIAGYTSLFTLIGLLTQRALAWGLAYILLWEGFVAGLSRSAGWLALRTYTTSTLGRVADVPDLIDDPVRSPTVVIVTLGVIAAAFALTTLRLRTMDVD